MNILFSFKATKKEDLLIKDAKLVSNHYNFFSKFE